MGIYLSERELAELELSANGFRSPVPTQIVSNGEFNPLPQTSAQKRVEARIKEHVVGGDPRPMECLCSPLSVPFDEAVALAALLFASRSGLAEVDRLDLPRAAKPDGEEAEEAKNDRWHVLLFRCQSSYKVSSM